ncbi:MAG: SH3 domain-containing protein [Anaerolineae bacterium]|nr:SH3 domain-containing protein [Anaerolineae bacterium]
MSLLLAFATVGSLSAGLIARSQAEDPAPDALGFFIVAGVIVLVGIIIVLIERAKAKPGWNASQGVMTIGVGSLLLVSLLVGPFVTNFVTQTVSGPVALAQTNDEVPDSVAPSPTATREAIVESTPTFVPMMTNTPAPDLLTEQETTVNPALDVLPTRYVYTTPVPTTVPALMTVCQATVQSNLNLRSAPSVNGQLLLTIPASSVVPVESQNADGSWFYVRYNNQDGWVSVDYLIPNQDCQNLPVRN